jgi:hypothetical protein
MAWGFSTGGNQATLVPPGIGGPNQDQLNMFTDAANQSGLTDIASQQFNQMANGMKNEDQVQMLYRLMALHPNEVALFFLEYPSFMAELSNLIGLIMRKELYAWFSGGAMNAEKAAALGYSTITQENIDAQIAKVVPTQQMQAAVSQADMQAMQMMSGHQQQQMMGNMQNQQQQQQMQQQQMYNQQMMGQQPPQRPGLGSALGGFGSSLLRGSLGLPPAQQMQQAPYQQGMYPPQ